jgi:hypothetical protein
VPPRLGEVVEHGRADHAPADHDDLGRRLHPGSSIQ